MSENLYFNIIPFYFPREEQTFYFTLEKADKCNKIYRTLFPNDIEIIFPGIHSDGTEFIYTTFDYAKEGFIPLEINFKTENQDLLRKYYNREIHHYFKSKRRQLVRRGFIGQNQIWVHCKKLSDAQFNVYQNFL